MRRRSFDQPHGIPGDFVPDLSGLGPRLQGLPSEFHSLLQGLLQGSMDAVFLFDEENRFQGINPAACALTGYAEEELLGLSVRDLVPAVSDQPPHLWRGFFDAGAGKTLTLFRKDASLVEVEYRTLRNVVPGIHLSFLRDVGPRRTAEAELRFQAGALSQVNDAVVAIDRNWRVTYWNPAAERTYELPREEVLGKPLADAYETRWASPDREREAHDLLASTGRWRGEVVHITRSGRALHVEAHVSALKGDPNVPPGFLAVLRDVTDRKRAEDLRAVLAQAVKSSGDAVVTKTPDGRVTSWNEGAERVFGYEEHEILGRPIDCLIPPECLEEHRALVDRVLRGERLEQVETRRRTKSGRLIDVAITLSPIRGEDGSAVGISKVARDITGVKRMREAVRRSEERLQEALRATGIVAWEWDPLRDMVTTTANVAEVYGLPQGAGVETYVAGMRLLHPDDRARHEAAVQVAVARKEPYVSQFRIIRPKDGRVVWMEEHAVPILGPDGRLLRLSGVVTDVTARKEVEDALRASEGRFRELADAMPQIVFSARPDGVIDYCNRRWTETTGSPAVPDNADSLIRIIHPDDLRRCRDAWTSSLRSGQPMEVEYRCRDAGRGAFRWHLGRAVPVRDSAGAVVRWFGTSTDIDDLKRSQEEVGRLNADLERRVAERTADLEASLRELDTFAYTVAHDLRSPLRAMAGFSDVLAWEYAGKPLDEEGGDLARRISEGARRMDALIQDLLTYSRLTRQRVDLEPVDLHTLVPEVLGEMREEIVRSRGRVDVVGPMPVAFAHRASLKQVLSNLLSNALKFVAPGVEPRVLLRPEREDSTIRIWVEDNGIGIAPEHRERNFGLFERLHPDKTTFPGTGIGLAIVRRAMERMEGSVGIEGAPGQGSRFYLELPLAEPDRAHSRRHRGAREGKEKRERRNGGKA